MNSTPPPAHNIPVNLQDYEQQLNRSNWRLFRAMKQSESPEKGSDRTETNSNNGKNHESSKVDRMDRELKSSCD